MSQMPSGHVRLKGRELLKKHKVSMYRLRERGAASYPTIHKYMTSDEKLDYLSADVLYGILIDGLEYSIEDAANLRLGDVFEFVPGNGDEERVAE